MKRCIREPQRGRSGWRGQAARRLAFEPLEDRRLLDGVTGGQAIELFSTSAALFVENQGQWEDESVRFLHQGDGVNVAMTDAGAVFQLFQRESRVRETHQEHPLNSDNDPLPDEDSFGALHAPYEPEDVVTRSTQFSVSFDGANVVEPVGWDRAETRFNYFVGQQEDWRADVPAYEVVAYENLYEGIDLLTWGRRDSLKYEFHVAPGADYRQIQVGYEGIEGLSLEADGSLRVDLADGWDGLVDDAPYIYQVIDGQEVEVAGRFELIDADSYMFVVTGDYDLAKELILDPDLAWATYLGGSKGDSGWGIAVDAAGNALVTGSTSSSGWVSGGFDTIFNGVYDAFVAKISAAGGHLWSTYLGGSRGDSGWGIAVDAAGNALVTGYTDSSGWVSGGFDTSYNGNRDAFVAKISAAGGHLWSTYLGGSRWDRGLGIAVDAADNALVAGLTESSGWVSGGFDTSYNGDEDAFVAKISAAGGHLWSTYLGGSRDDAGGGIAVDAAGNALVTGQTRSSGWVSGGFDTSYNGGRDGFVAKIGGVVLPVKDPVLLVPGILGSWPTPGKFLDWVRSYDGEFGPEDLTLLSFVLHPYDAMIEALEANGYVQGVDLFAAPYDWRLPIGNSPDSDFDEGVDYLSYWIEKARAAWIDRGLDGGAFEVDVVAHSMGGLVTRAYIQNDPAGEVVDDFIMVGTPNYGSVDAYVSMEEKDRRLRNTELLVAASVFGGPGMRALQFAQKYVGIDRLENFMPGVLDLLPTFDFVNDPGPEPTGKYANPWLRALNEPANLEKLLGDGDTTVTLIGGASFLTARTVADGDGIGGSGPAPQLLRIGDGTVLSGHEQRTGIHLPGVPLLEFTPNLPLPDGHRYYRMTGTDEEHRNLLRDQDVQRIVLAALGIVDPVLGPEPQPAPRPTTERYIYADPVDFLLTDPLGRRLGYTAETGELNEIPGAYYSGNAELEFAYIPEPEEGNWSYHFETLGEDYQVEGEVVSSGGVEMRSWSGSEPAGTQFDEEWATGTLTLYLAAASDTGRLGDGVTKFESVTLEGTTEPGLDVALDVDDDGLFDDGSAVADASGNYTFIDVPLAEGVNLFRVRVIDATAIQTITARSIARIDTSPFLEPEQDRTVFLGDTLTLEFFASDADGDTLTFSLDEAPDGAAVDPATGVFSWTPVPAQLAEEHTVTARVTDDGSPVRFDTTTFSVYVEFGEARIVGRYIFYNNSAFDTLGDADAIVPSPQELTAAGKDPKWGKQALLPGQIATFQNYTTYSRGINGIMVDIAGLPAETTELTTDDFEFRTGNSSDLAIWSDPAVTPQPQDVTLDRSGGGPARVTLIWADKVIQNEWLQVTVKANENTGLTEDDVFYFGNTSGEAGNLYGDANPDALVTYADLIQTRNNIGLTTEVPVGNGFDFNRDKFVTYSDLILCRNNINLTSGLNLITAPLPAAAAARDAVLEQTVEREPSAYSPSLSELTWLLDYEWLIGRNRPGRKQASGDEAVDKLLATWP